jgi:hypothetical protein
MSKKIYPGMLCKIVGPFREESRVLMFDYEENIDDFFVEKDSFALVLSQDDSGMLTLLTSTKQIGIIHSCVCDIIG